MSFFDRHKIVGMLPAPVRLAKRAVQDWMDGEPELRLLPELCPKGCIALDIGANYGVYSWHLSRIADRVVAFEPQHRMAEFIRAASRRKVRVEEVALSDHVGEAVLRVPDETNLDGCATIEPENKLSSAHVRSETVPIRRLDDFGFSGVGFIKLDVEGHELSVLRGATELLRRDRPNLLVEAEERHRHNALESLVEFLRGFGYSGSYLSNGRLIPIKAGETPRNGSGVPVYNFVFRPAK